MMKINCPWCGSRNQDEFKWGGQAHIIRPPFPDLTDDQEWSNYLFDRDNVCGPAKERWVHLHGCGQWFNALRDTASHRILAVYGANEDLPEFYK